jgi:hypothetical protein
MRAVSLNALTMADVQKGFRVQQKNEAATPLHGGTKTKRGKDLSLSDWV